MGEIGLDLYWSRDFREERPKPSAARSTFRCNTDCRSPCIRATRPKPSPSCANTAAGASRGVFHAYSDGIETYRKLKECGDFVFGIGGVVTFKKSRLAEVAGEMELRDLVLETDCPYLTPGASPGRAQRIGLGALRLRKSRPNQGTDPGRGRGSDDGQCRKDVRTAAKPARPQSWPEDFRCARGESGRPRSALRRPARNCVSSGPPRAAT